MRRQKRQHILYTTSAVTFLLCERTINRVYRAAPLDFTPHRSRDIAYSHDILVARAATPRLFLVRCLTFSSVK